MRRSPAESATGTEAYPPTPKTRSGPPPSQDRHRRGNPEGHPVNAGKSPDPPPPNLAGRDEVDGEPPGRHGARFEAPLGSDEGDGAAGTEREERLSKRDPRKDVPAGPSPGDDHPQ